LEKLCFFGRLKTLLLGPPLPPGDMVARFWSVSDRRDCLRDALPGWHDFLSALLAFIDDPALGRSLDRFVPGRDTPALPVETAWLESGG
jgi:hypothetical protein